MMWTDLVNIRTTWLPTIEVEELNISETIVLKEDDYSWYEFYGEQCLCVTYGCPADNNWDNPLPIPEEYKHR